MILSIIWIELFLVAAVVGVRRVRIVRSDRTPKTHRTVRIARTVRLFVGLKSDLCAGVSVLGFALQSAAADSCDQSLKLLSINCILNWPHSAL